MTSTPAERTVRILLAITVTFFVLCAAVPLLLIWWLASPEPTPSAEDAGVMDQLRDVAYALRNDEVRSAVDAGTGLPAVARSMGVSYATRAEVRAASYPGSGGLVLLDARAVGRTGVAVDLVQSRVPIGQSTTLFAREERPWVGCYRVELPVTAIAVTGWTAHDTTCPTFSDALQHADRVHVDGATARPLLRPPCFGTTGYCPGG